MVHWYDYYYFFICHLIRFHSPNSLVFVYFTVCCLSEIRKSFIAKCACTHKEFALVLRLPVHIVIQIIIKKN